MGFAFSVDAVGRAGGVAILWKKADAMILIGFFPMPYRYGSGLGARAKMEVDRLLWVPRHLTWNLLRALSGNSFLPWCCMGDFNDITCMEEKRKGECLNPHGLWKALMKLFRTHNYRIFPYKAILTPGREQE